MRDWQEIAEIIRTRMDARGTILTQMLEVRDRYNADFTMPWIDNVDHSDVPHVAPQLIAEAIDDGARRAASTMPDITVPAITRSTQVGPRSREYAVIRRRALKGTWHQEKMKLKLRRAYRHLRGYDTCTLAVHYGPNEQMPRIKVRDPLSTFPDETACEDFDDIQNVGFVYGKSAAWLRAMWPKVRYENGGPIKRQNDDIWDVCEWIDGEAYQLGIIGPRDEFVRRQVVMHDKVDVTFRLWSMENVLGVVPVVTGSIPTLDRLGASMASQVGATDLLGKLLTLEVIAAEKAIFPDIVAIQSDGGIARVQGGTRTLKDGRSGEINVLENVAGIDVLRTTPDPAGERAADRIERNFRIREHLTPQAGGETYGALRTGRGIDALLSAAVDPDIQEVQEVMEVALTRVNEHVLRCYRDVYGTTSFSLYTGEPTDDGFVEFEPRKHVETLENTVAYALAGADMNSLTLQLGQLKGMEAMATKTLRQYHPLIRDPEGEERRLMEEKLETTFFASLQQQAMTGQLPPDLWALLEETIRQESTPDIMQAFAKANEEYQRRQAELAPPPEDPNMLGPPEAQLGLAAGPTAGVQAAEPPVGIQEPAPSQDNLRELFNALRTGIGGR